MASPELFQATPRYAACFPFNGISLYFWILGWRRLRRSLTAWRARNLPKSLAEFYRRFTWRCALFRITTSPCLFYFVSPRMRIGWASFQCRGGGEAPGSAGAGSQGPWAGHRHHNVHLSAGGLPHGQACPAQDAPHQHRSRRGQGVVGYSIM